MCSLVRCTISHLAEQYGWNNLPPVLKGNSTASVIALGHAEEMLCLLEVLYRVSAQQSLITTSPRAPQAVNRKQGAHHATFPPSTSTDGDKKGNHEGLSLHSVSQAEGNGVGPMEGREGKPPARHISFGLNSTRLIPYSGEDVDTSFSSACDAVRDSSQEAEHLPPPPPPTARTKALPSQAPPTQSEHRPIRGQHRTASAPRGAPPSSMEALLGSSDMDLVFGSGDWQRDGPSQRSMPLPHGLSSAERVKIIQWLSALGISARPPPDTPPSSSSPSSQRPSLDLENDWINGVLLSEVAAACSRGNRGEVKEVRIYKTGQSCLQLT